jgi:uncharacterized protein YuzB (UPF0349 family)
MKPIIEFITENIVNALKTVRTANGYLSDLEVEQYNRATGNRTRNQLAVVMQGGCEEVLQDVSDGFKEWMQEYRVGLFILESDTSTRPLDQRLNLIRCDCEKALCIDRSRGGYALDTMMRGHLVHEDRGGVELLIDVWYRHLEDNPFNQGD